MDIIGLYNTRWFSCTISRPVCYDKGDQVARLLTTALASTCRRHCCSKQLKLFLCWQQIEDDQPVKRSTARNATTFLERYRRLCCSRGGRSKWTRPVEDQGDPVQSNFLLSRTLSILCATVRRSYISASLQSKRPSRNLAYHHLFHCRRHIATFSFAVDCVGGNHGPKDRWEREKTCERCRIGSESARGQRRRWENCVWG